MSTYKTVVNGCVRGGVAYSGNDVGRYQRSYSTSSVVSTGRGNRLRTDKPPRYATSHPGQLSLLPYVGREMSTGQSAVMLCGSRQAE